MKIYTVSQFVVEVSRCLRDDDIETLECLQDHLRDWLISEDEEAALNDLIDTVLNILHETIADRPIDQSYAARAAGLDSPQRKCKQ